MATNAPSQPAVSDDAAPDGSATANPKILLKVTTSPKGKKSIVISYPASTAVAKPVKPRAPRKVPEKMPCMPASLETYYSRKNLPLKLRHYRVPADMRAPMCRLLDSDEAASGMELLVSSLVHIDLERLYGRIPEFHRPFELSFPVGVRVSKDEPQVDLMAFVVNNMARNYPGVVVNALALDKLRAFFRFTIMDQACPAMRHPCDIASALFVGAIMYNPFVDESASRAAHVAAGGAGDAPEEEVVAIGHMEAALRAAAFLANIVLLGENMPPLRAEEIRSPLIRVAYTKDVTSWYNRDKHVNMPNECTHAFFKALRRGCHYCCATPAKLSRCGRCHIVQYCSHDCQVADWVRHKPFCNDNRNAAAEYAKTTQ